MRKWLAAWAMRHFDLFPGQELRFRGRRWQLESALYTTALHDVDVLILRMRPPLYFAEFTDDSPDL